MSNKSRRSNPVARAWYKTAKWRQIRAFILANNPACIRCGSEANTVDHKVAHKGDERLFFSIDNLQSMCKVCHDSWKARYEGGRIDTACSDEGLPEDPRHPWNL